MQIFKQLFLKNFILVQKYSHFLRLGVGISDDVTLHLQISQKIQPLRR